MNRAPRWLLVPRVARVLGWIMVGAPACGAGPEPAAQHAWVEERPSSRSAAAVEPRPRLATLPEMEFSVASMPDASAADPLPALRFRFVGDIIFGRYRKGTFHAIANDAGNPFEEVSPFLSGDFVFANLETPVLPKLPPRNDRKGFFFGATQAMAQSLVDAGFDAVSVANNHAADLGVEGLRQTPSLLRELGIEPLGEARASDAPIEVTTLDVAGISVGVVAVTTLRNFAMPDRAPAVPFVPTSELEATLGPVLRAARAGHDILIVSVHWGVEYARYPEKVQRIAARAMIDSGVDFVIGHHPHVLQEVESYGGGLIAYSLGNFLFENTSKDARLSGVLSVEIDRPALCGVRVRFIPVALTKTPFIHPRPATLHTAKLAHRRVLPLTREQRARWRDDGDQLATEYQRPGCEKTP